MKKVFRSAVVVAAVASSIAMVGTPASAAGVVQFHGTATIDCFGCGVSSGTADLSVTGVINGDVLVEAPATANYTVNEPTGVTCVVTGAASGRVTVDGTGDRVHVVDFNWTRVGATAVITTTGDIAGIGEAFFVAHVSGLPCGTTNLSADVAGWVAGG